MHTLPESLAAFTAYQQFIIYKLIPSEKKPGKFDKLPCDFRNGHVVSAHNSEYWTNAATAIAAAAQWGSSYGVAFVFTEFDPFWFIDIDDCLQADGNWSTLARSLCAMFSGAAMEVSQSGKGLHIFGTGRPPAHGCKNESLHIEFYHTGRFVALSGIESTGNVSTDFSHLLPALVAQYFPPKTGTAAAQAWTDQPSEDWNGPTDDEELIKRMMRSQSASSAFANKACFADLWLGNVEALRNSYPDEGRPYNESQADAALAQHLAFWTGRDCERMSRLMWRSALVRNKWERDDYLPRTILVAVGQQLEVLTDQTLQPVETESTSASTGTPRPALTTGKTYADTNDQLQIFAGCVYIQTLHKVLIPGGILLKPEQFKVAYGGYTFTMDTANEKTSRDAWEAFTQNQAYRCPRADLPCFKPELPAGAIVKNGGQTFANTYWPVEIRRVAGDPKLFLDHLAKVLPDNRDRQILLSYMAACVQHAGIKFQWTTLLQGAEGNGKTLFTRCVAEAVGRRYVHWPKASKLCNQFNGWMVGKVFYAVEDIYVPNHRREIIEELKPMITGGDGLEIEGKGIDQISADICGNFMMNCNNQDAVVKTINDRRYCTLFTAQQSAADIIRDGMGGDYFPKLYDWLRNDGYAIVSELLHTWPIPDEFNPATHCQRAPATSTTQLAIEASAGNVEQEIAEAVEQGLPGFRGGWVSSIQLGKLLEQMGVALSITHHRRKKILESLGYVYHPSLINGRVNNIVVPDGGKPRLFIKAEHEACRIGNPTDVALAYELANTGSGVRMPFKYS